MLNIDKIFHLCYVHLVIILSLIVGSWLSKHLMKFADKFFQKEIIIEHEYYELVHSMSMWDIMM